MCGYSILCAHAPDLRTFQQYRLQHYQTWAVSYFGREAAWKVARRETSGTKVANPLRIEDAPDIAQTSGRAFSAA